jgi:hypothetical protein
MKNIVVVDIDGTVADREEYLQEFFQFHTKNQI